MRVTPAGSGGIPATVHSNCDHASRCGARSESVVHEALISNSTLLSCAANAPKLSDATAVMVPPRARVSGWVAIFSSTQLQATPGSSGSCPISGSSAARAKVTARKSPSQEACPSGSCRTTNLPEATGASSMSWGRNTSAVSASEKGAKRLGAGTSVRTTSGRTFGARRLAKAARKESGTSWYRCEATNAHYDHLGREAARRADKYAGCDLSEIRESGGTSADENSAH